MAKAQGVGRKALWVPGIVVGGIVGMVVGLTLHVGGALLGGTVGLVVILTTIAVERISVGRQDRAQR